jgi:hypothetical protein
MCSQQKVIEFGKYCTWKTGTKTEVPLREKLLSHFDPEDGSIKLIRCYVVHRQANTVTQHELSQREYKKLIYPQSI